jgi:hypothetical protein
VISQCIRGLAAPRLAWVLWLAMLLPLAQLAANWHVQSHWDTERSGASLVIAHAPARQPAAQLPDGPRWSAPLLRAYESRAPPSLLG